VIWVKNDSPTSRSAWHLFHSLRLREYHEYNGKTGKWDGTLRQFGYALTFCGEIFSYPKAVRTKPRGICAKCGTVYASITRDGEIPKEQLIIGE
jgi:hypothetical protein